MKQNKELLPVLAGLCTSIIFGFSYLFIKEALDAVSPFHLLALRFALAAVVLTLLRVARIIKIDLSLRKVLLLLPLAFLHPVLYFSLETVGVNGTTASESGMVMALIPVLSTILGAVFLKEIPSRLQSLFILLTVSGVLLIVAMKDVQGESGSMYGIYLLVLAVTVASVYRILARRLSVHYKAIEITYVMMWLAAICFNGVSFISHLWKGNLGSYFLPLQSLPVVSSLLYLGVLSSIVAFFLLNYAISKLEVSRSAVMANLTTVVSVVSGVLLRNDPFHWYHAVGVAMILAGVWGTNYFKKASSVDVEVEQSIQ